MTRKWNLIVEIDKCNGCFNCVLAAKDEYVGNSEPGYFAAQPRHGHEWIGVQCKERGQYPVVDVTFLPVMCNHCDEAPCLRAAKDGAVTKRPDGIVIIDPEKSRGQRQIVDACPYGAVFWNDELQIPQHWPFDAHLLDNGWKAPRCVEVCATGALTAIKTDDATIQKMAAEEGLSVRQPGLGTQPRIYYKNLQRVECQFISGTVTHLVDGRIECADGSVVTLHYGQNPVKTTLTDAFGDFRFDGLERGSGPYQVVAAYGAARAETSVENLDGSRFVGTMRLL